MPQSKYQDGNTGIYAGQNSEVRSPVWGKPHLPYDHCAANLRRMKAGQEMIPVVLGEQRLTARSHPMQASVFFLGGGEETS